MGANVFCTNCDKEDKTLNLDNAICKECGFDNSYVYGLVSAEDGDKEDDFEDEFQTALACAHDALCYLALCQPVMVKIEQK